MQFMKKTRLVVSGLVLIILLLSQAHAETIPKTADLTAEQQKILAWLQTSQDQVVVFPEIAPETPFDALPSPKLPVAFFRSRARLLLLRFFLSEITAIDYEYDFTLLEAAYAVEFAKVTEWLHSMLKNHFPDLQEREEFIFTKYLTAESKWLEGADLFVTIRTDQETLINNTREQVSQAIFTAPPPLPADDMTPQAEAFMLVDNFRQAVPDLSQLEPALFALLDRIISDNTELFYQRLACLRQQKNTTRDKKTAEAVSLAYDFRSLLNLPLSIAPDDALPMILGIEGTETPSPCLALTTAYEFEADNTLLAEDGHRNSLAYLQLLLLYADFLTGQHSTMPDVIFGLARHESAETPLQELDMIFDEFITAINESVRIQAEYLVSLDEKSLDQDLASWLRYDIAPRYGLKLPDLVLEVPKP